MESERERLERMYGEMGDEHLRDLAEDRESLTVDGQMALAKVLAARGMAAPACGCAYAAGWCRVWGPSVSPGLRRGFRVWCLRARARWRWRSSRVVAKDGTGWRG